MSTALITGATSGIGLETAKALDRVRGFKVMRTYGRWKLQLVGLACTSS